MHFARQLQPAQHRVLRLIVAGSPHLVWGFVSAGCDQAIGAERLKLDLVSAGCGGNIDQLVCQSQITIMVDTSFGDDQCLQKRLFRDGMAVPDSQSTSSSSPMPIIQRSPTLTFCRTVALLPMKLPVPMRTPPLRTAAVAMWQWSAITASCSTSAWLLMMQLQPMTAPALTMAPCMTIVPAPRVACFDTRASGETIVGSPQRRLCSRSNN